MNSRDLGALRRVIWRSGVFIGLVAALSGCSSGSEVNTAARDRCEAKWGVGNCVERDQKWVPLAISTTTSTTSFRATTTIATTPISTTTTSNPLIHPTLPPATTPSAVAVCSDSPATDGRGFMVGDCASGTGVNAQAWAFYAKHFPLILSLGPHASAQQITDAAWKTACTTLDASFSQVSTVVHTAAQYYGWDDARWSHWDAGNADGTRSCDAPPATTPSTTPAASPTHTVSRPASGGWVTIFASIPIGSPGVADQTLDDWLAKGFGAEVVDSRDYAGLGDPYWVLVNTGFSTRQDAVDNCDFVLGEPPFAFLTQCSPRQL